MLKQVQHDVSGLRIMNSESYSSSTHYGVEESGGASALSGASLTQGYLSQFPMETLVIVIYPIPRIPLSAGGTPALPCTYKSLVKGRLPSVNP